MLDFSRPVTYGAQTESDWHFEHKAKQHKAIMDSRPIIDDVYAEFEKLTGRKYNRVESYLMEDADVAIVALGSTVETARVAAEQLRKETGVKAGVVAIRCFRPFPFDEVRNALENVKCVVEANVDDDVEYITVEELEGEKFEIYAVTEDYVIVIIDDEIYIVSKD